MEGSVRSGCFLLGKDGHLRRSSSAPALHCHLYNSRCRFNGRNTRLYEALQARQRYTVIYTTARAVSTGAFDFDVLNNRLKPFIGKSVTLPDRPVINDAQPGRMNAICISDPHATSFMVIAANKTNTTIHAFEYVKLQQAVDLAPHVGELGSITGTLRKVEPNPNKSPALVLRIYIGDATIAFSKALLGPPAVTVL